MKIPLINRGGGETAVDPVCHMDVDMAKPNGGTYEHKGDTYYFCGPGCNRAFAKDPEAYLAGENRMER